MQLHSRSPIIKAIKSAKNAIPSDGGLSPGEIALTFDDGPHCENTVQILAALKQASWPAHFFNLGVYAESYPELVRQTAEGDHTLGSHTFSHRDLLKLSLNDARAEIRQGVSAVRDAAGIEPKLFRFPYGYKTDALEELVQAEQLVTVDWNIDPKDWEIADPNELLEIIMSMVVKERRGILLLHEFRSQTVRMLPTLLSNLRELRFTPVQFVIV